MIIDYQGTQRYTEVSNFIWDRIAMSCVMICLLSLLFFKDNLSKYVSVKFQKQRSNHHRARASRSPKVAGTQKWRGNTSVYPSRRNRPYLLAGFTTRAEHQQSRPLASSCPATSPDHSKLILSCDRNREYFWHKRSWRFPWFGLYLIKYRRLVLEVTWGNTSVLPIPVKTVHSIGGVFESLSWIFY